jgi:hypothetical protein
VVNTHPVDEVEVGREVFDSERLSAFNDELAAAAAERDLTLLDWNATVAAVALTDDGYHPYLDPSDWFHLVPGQGDEARLALVERGIRSCR